MATPIHTAMSTAASAAMMPIAGKERYLVSARKRTGFVARLDGTLKIVLVAIVDLDSV